MEYSLTNPQNSIWLTEKFYSGTSINNISGYNYIHEPVDFSVLSNAINEVVKQNDAMRIKVKEENNSCVQYISEYIPFTINTIELTKENEIRSTALKLAEIPFNIENNLLFKFTFFKLPNGNGGFFLSAHHLIGDSWSLGLVVKQIMLGYSDMKKNEYIAKESPSYTSYIKDEKKYLESDKFKKDKKYWDDVFKTVPEVATIPSFKKQNSSSCNGDRLDFSIDTKLVNSINNYCKEKKVSLYNFFMALYSFYLGQVSSLDDFVIGTPVLNRTNFEQKNTMGMFISTAPLRINLNYNLSFTDFVKDISSRTISLFRHQKYPYQYILENLRTKDSSIPNLYNVVLSYQITKTFDEECNINYTSEWLSNGCCADDLQIHLLDINDDGKIHILYDYKTDKYSKQDISDLHARILTMLNQVMSNNDILLNDIEIITPEEKQKILYDFNNTKVDYPKDKTIIDLFEEQVEKTPNNIAVVFEDQKLTYKELNEKANQLARYLIDFGIKEQDAISVMLPKSLDFIISVFAILKIRGIYVPIYPKYPLERIQLMLNDSNSKAIITNKNYNLNGINNNLIINIDSINLNTYLPLSIELIYSPQDIIYEIFTSGSTGTPKGVKISNYNLVNFVYSFNDYFNNITSSDKFLSSTNISFDVSMWELFVPICFGAQLFFNKFDVINNIFDFCEQIIKNEITALYIPPNILDEVYSILEKEDYKKINKLLVGVEPINGNSLDNYFNLNNNIIIINGYGPTETTICATAFKYMKNLYTNSVVPIGRALNNNNIYILSNNLKLLPPNTPGELYISGAGVGYGYINNEEKNKIAFILNPFIKGQRMYKSGDIARWTSDGIITFIGRTDKQVKISGYRIELNEINHNILSYPNINKSIVNVFEEKNIICYFSSKEIINIKDLKEYLKAKLPNYMVPKFFIQINTWPTNINGKINYADLPKPQSQNNINNQIHNPTNDVELFILNTLQALTSIEKIDIYGDFDNLCLDSLDYIKLSTSIYKKYNVSLSANEIMHNNSIRTLSDLIIKSSSNKSIISKIEMEFYPLSAEQEGIYYSYMLDKNSTLYNTAGGIIVEGNLDLIKIEACINTLINRHQALRTHFELKDDTVVQFINENIDFKLDVEECTTDNLEEIYNNFVKPFNLSKAPLFRAKAAKLLNGNILILLDMHHIISDGVSLKIFIEELCALYNSETLPIQNIDYTDFCLWEKEQFKTDEFKAKKEFWLNKFNGDIPLLNMPTTYPRPSVQSFEGKDFRLNLSKDIFNKINDVAKSLNITPYMLMLSCYYILLYKYTAQNDTVVGSPIVGRELPELSNVLGMFVNTLALRNYVDSSLSFEDFSKNIKENCLEYFKNQSYPFDMLVKDLKIKRDTSRNPLFDTVFVYQNDGYPQFNINGVNSKYYTPQISTSKFDLTLEVIPNNGEYSLRFEYCTKLFDEKFMRRLSSHYINILNSVLNNAKTKISNIDMLSSDEREKILYDFNDIEEPTNDDTFVSLFEKEVEKNPNNIALICDNKSLTYSELNKKANSLAHFLIEHDVKQNDIIAIMTDRSLETIVCMLAISKAGAAFVNMDPTYPIERTTYYLNDCKAKCVLKQKHLSLPVKNFNEIYEIDLTNKDIYDKNTDNPNLKINLDSLSYIIYTSGSTGVPKGVVLNQLGLANMCKAMTLVLDYLKDGPNHAILSVTSTPFDIFVYEITVSLSHGMRVVLANNAEHRDPKLVDMLIRKYNVDVMTVTPSLMKINYDNREPNSALANVKNMVFGGEPLSEKFVHDLKSLSSDITIYNIYGPSEITVLSNVQNLNGEDKISIGPPILNTKIYVLDNDMNPLPIGLTGEIYIGGVQVGYGYLGKEDLTNEKFINNPFAPGKMFKSGDIGRWTEDGKLQCLGRIDHQIKLRGLRVELGEIEKLLEAIPEVDEAVVNKVTVDNKEALCAYYVLNSSIDEILLRNTLREKLPYYMVPTYFMKLDKMPYSINRKIDRKALPVPTPSSVINKRSINTASLNTVEDKLLFIWKNVLHTDDININDNFFDVGGDSIAAIQVQIEAVKLGINIEYSDIFKYPTIKQLTNNINKNECYDLTQFTNSNILDVLKNNNDKALSSIKKAKFKNILIIGTTGYLGIHLIYEFLTTCKGNAYCLIRPKNNLSPEQRLEDMFIFYFGNKCYEKYKKRIIIVKGDITIDNLGLSNDDLELIKNNVDVIINSGALVKHYGTSKLFEDINVHGTQNVVDFCLKHKKRLLHISTISVSGNGERIDDYDSSKLEKNIFTERDLYIGQQVNGIYTYTKYQAECIVLNAISNGLNAMIFRVGNVTNRFTDGMFQRNFNDNAFAKRIKSFIDIGAFPEYFLQHELELSPVDLCAKAIIKSLKYESNCNVLHIYNSHLLAINTFLEVLRSLNIKLVPVSNKLMKDIITGILEDNTRKDIVSGIIYDLDKNKNLVYTSNISLNSDFSNKYLNKIGFYWKKIDKNYLNKCMKYFKKIGFIDF